MIAPAALDETGKPADFSMMVEQMQVTYAIAAMILAQFGATLDHVVEETLYVLDATIGGENVVKVYTAGDKPDQVATIPVGAPPHGAWASDDGSRMYVGLENGDAVEVIGTASNKMITRVPAGQALQALVYISNAVPNGSGLTNLVPRGNSEPINIALNAIAGDAKGFVVARNPGGVDASAISLFKLKPQTVYSVYGNGQKIPVASFTTNSTGAANGTMIGPLREVSNTLAVKTASPSRIVMEGEAPADPEKAVLVSAS